MLARYGLRLAVSLAAILAVTVPAQAQRGGRRGLPRPFVVEVDFTLERSGERGRKLNLDRPLSLATGERVVIVTTPLDENRRRFPLDRFRLDTESGRDCRGRVRVSEWSNGDLQVQAGNNRGRCTVTVWVPGNLNLEYELTFDVGGLSLTNYSQRQAREIVERLFRAILQRDVDQGSRREARVEVQRGRLEKQVQSMVTSSEFRELRQRQSDADLVIAFYKGMLDREPDARGLRQYLNDVTRGQYAKAIMDLVQSEEFESGLPAR
jgi:hypothetical protein